MHDFTDLPALVLPDTAIACVIQVTDPVDFKRVLFWQHQDRHVLRVPRNYVATAEQWDAMQKAWNLKPMGTHTADGWADIYFKRTVPGHPVSLDPWEPFVLVS